MNLKNNDIDAILTSYCEKNKRLPDISYSVKIRSNSHIYKNNIVYDISNESEILMSLKHERNSSLSIHEIEPRYLHVIF